MLLNPHPTSPSLKLPSHFLLFPLLLLALLLASAHAPTQTRASPAPPGSPRMQILGAGGMLSVLRGAPDAFFFDVSDPTKLKYMGAADVQKVRLGTDWRPPPLHPLPDFVSSTVTSKPQSRRGATGGPPLAVTLPCLTPLWGSLSVIPKPWLAACLCHQRPLSRTLWLEGSRLLRPLNTFSSPKRVPAAGLHHRRVCAHP